MLSLLYDGTENALEYKTCKLYGKYFLFSSPCIQRADNASSDRGSSLSGEKSQKLMAVVTV